MESSITSFCNVGNINAHGKIDVNIVKDFKEPEYKKIEVRDDLIPEGAKLVECYLTDSQVIVCGDPCDDENHNCDQMGCSSMSHVIHRFHISDSWENKQ